MGKEDWKPEWACELPRPSVETMWREGEREADLAEVWRWEQQKGNARMHLATGSRGTTLHDSLQVLARK